MERAGTLERVETSGQPSENSIQKTQRVLKVLGTKAFIPAPPGWTLGCRIRAGFSEQGRTPATSAPSPEGTTPSHTPHKTCLSSGDDCHWLPQRLFPHVASSVWPDHLLSINLLWTSPGLTPPGLHIILLGQVGQLAATGHGRGSGRAPEGPFRMEVWLRTLLEPTVPQGELAQIPGYSFTVFC